MSSSGSFGWAPEQLLFLHSERQHPFLQSVVRILMIDAPVAQLHDSSESMQYRLPAMRLVPQSQCTSDLDPLRRMRQGRDQVCIFQEEC